MPAQYKPLGIILITLYSVFFGVINILASYSLAALNEDYVRSTELDIMSYLLLIGGTALITSAYGLWKFKYWGQWFTRLIYSILILVCTIFIFPILPRQQMTAVNTVIQLSIIGVSTLIIWYLSKPEIDRLIPISDHTARAARGSPEALAAPMWGLKWSLVTNMVAFTGIIATGNQEHQNHLSLLLVRLFFILILLAEVWFYICLGILANRLGRSSAKWIVINLLISPLGMVLAFFLMRRNVRQTQSEPHVENHAGTPPQPLSHARLDVIVSDGHQTRKIMPSLHKPMGIVLISLYSAFFGVISVPMGCSMAVYDRVSGAGPLFDFMSFLLIASGAALITSAYGLWTFQPWGQSFTRLIYLISILISVIFSFPIMPGTQITLTYIAVQLSGIVVDIIIIRYLTKPEIIRLY